MSGRRSRRGGTALAAAVLLASGCASPSEVAPPASPPPSSAPAAANGPGPQAGRHPTIADYLKGAGITERLVTSGDPGIPTVQLPIPPGWRDGAGVPPYALASRVQDDPTLADPASIVVLMSELTGPVDGAKLLEYAAGELMNLPGFESVASEPTTLDGFAGYLVGGTYVRDGVRRFIGQKTVVIPTDGATYVLQLNAGAPEPQVATLAVATAIIDEQTTIVP